MWLPIRIAARLLLATLEAAAQGKRLMVYSYQDGCPYCERLLETNSGLRDIATRTQATVYVISINMGVIARSPARMGG